MQTSDRWRPVAWMLFVALCLPAGLGAAESDWPMWRHDSGRTAATSHELPAAPRLLWKRELPRPAPTFPNDLRLGFDRSYEPVAAGKRMFVPSMVTDSVTALDTGTGRELWRCFADGPVRFAPAVWKDRVCFVSDDGFLYCVGADDGRLIWKFTPLEPERRAFKLLGDERLVSRWPARGGPVLADGTVYFAAGIWQFEGVMVCAVDVATGQPLWINKDCAFVKDGLVDHSTRLDGGLSPQGYLAVLGPKLIVPCGRALPGLFDRATGRMEPYTTGWGGRVGLAKGCWYACGIGDWLFQSGDLYQLHASASATAPKPGEFVRVEDFARQMKVSPVTVERWIKQFKLDVVVRDGRRWFQARNGDEISYLSWWTSRKTEPARPGEQHALETRTRLQIDPGNAKELGAFREPVLTDDTIYYSSPASDYIRPIRNSNEDRKQPKAARYTEIVACGLTGPLQWKPVLQGGWGDPQRLVSWSGARFDQLWSLLSSLKVQIKAGRRLYAGGPGMVAAVDIPTEGQPAKVSWRATIVGTPHRMLAADGKLFVVTAEGTLYCFGEGAAAAKHYALAPDRPASPADAWTARAGEILQQAGVREGYGVALGVGSGRLVEELARQSRLRMIVLEPDAAKVTKARRELHRLGLYGSRVHVLPGDLETLRLAPFLASVVVAEEFPERAFATNETFLSRLFALLRPYGGSACFAMTPNDHESFARRIQSAALAGAEVARIGGLSVLARRGALPDAADWANESGDAGHTFASLDRRVAAPFGVLWFGGGLDRVVPWIEGDPPRLPGEAAPLVFAGAGPRPRVAGGRLFVAIGDELYASDIYTGRHLWKRTLKSLGDVAAAEDSVYALASGSCLHLDAVTGETLATFAAAGAGWQQIRIRGDSLVGVAGKSLVCLDRHGGTLRWKRSSQRDGFSFAVGSDRVFCVDYWLPRHRRKEDPKSEEAEIAALKLSSGEPLWRVQASTPAIAAGTKFAKFAPPLNPQLAFSDSGDALLFTRNTATVAAYRGATGQLLWSKEWPCKEPPTAFTSFHPPVVLADRFVTHGGEVVALATGEPCATRLWKGNGSLRGCGRALGCPHLILMRDGYGSHLDLATGARTYFRGIRSGCTNTLIPADGVLCAPNYARHCNCNYPINTSMAFVAMPEAAAWDLALADRAQVSASAAKR
ncbi:MAG: PQQ-binding-like beta-propeller repeat protein [Verrucomicrobia bacterium]|nr:PQQ-binding-like beta-propeller repeat protein [Verrucomicrobiota bacterium]